MVRTMNVLFSLSTLLLGKFGSAQLTSALVPAYVYPSTATTWQPLYDQIHAHPNVTFTIVLNPNSGPGAPADGVSNSDYQREVAKIRAYANARIVGYVHTTWAKRPIADVKTDIDTWASWPATNSAMWVDGVFFDEAPLINQSGNITYMQNLITYVRNKKRTTGSTRFIGKNTSPYIVTNPGAAPENKTYLNTYPAPDLALVREDSYAAWNSDVAGNSAKIYNLDADNNQLAVMLHDMPTNLGCAGISSLAHGLKNNAGVGTLWFTNLQGNASYTNWPSKPLFGEYVNSFESNTKAC